MVNVASKFVSKGGTDVNVVDFCTKVVDLNVTKFFEDVICTRSINVDNVSYRQVVKFVSKLSNFNVL